MHLFRLFGDATGDGIVDLSDLGLFRTAFNAGIMDPAYRAFFDANHDTTIDLTDLAQFSARYNTNVF